MGKVRGVEVKWGIKRPKYQILDMKNFRLFMPNPLENGSDDEPEDVFKDNDNVDVYPEPNLEAWEQCHFNLDFPKLDHLKASFESIAERSSNPLINKDQEFKP